MLEFLPPWVNVWTDRRTDQDAPDAALKAPGGLACDWYCHGNRVKAVNQRGEEPQPSGAVICPKRETSSRKLGPGHSLPLHEARVRGSEVGKVQNRVSGPPVESEADVWKHKQAAKATPSA